MSPCVTRQCRHRAGGCRQRGRRWQEVRSQLLEPWNSGSIVPFLCILEILYILGPSWGTVVLAGGNPVPQRGPRAQFEICSIPSWKQRESCCPGNILSRPQCWVPLCPRRAAHSALLPLQPEVLLHPESSSMSTGECFASVPLASIPSIPFASTPLAPDPSISLGIHPLQPLLPPSLISHCIYSIFPPCVHLLHPFCICLPFVFSVPLASKPSVPLVSIPVSICSCCSSCI